MRTNKRRLYESIMKDVSKTVKKRLNERYLEFENNFYFMISVDLNAIDYYKNINQIISYLKDIQMDTDDLNDIWQNISDLNSGDCIYWKGSDNTKYIIGKI